MKSALDIQHKEIINGFSHQPTRLESGKLFQNICVVAWSTNLQSSFGVTTLLREELSRRAAYLSAHLLGQ
jgi:hypothetical protein